MKGYRKTGLCFIYSHEGRRNTNKTTEKAANMTEYGIGNFPVQSRLLTASFSRIR